MYRIKEDKTGFTPQFQDQSGQWQDLSTPKPNKPTAQWVIDAHAKGGSTNVSETYHTYTPNTKINLHD